MKSKKLLAMLMAMVMSLAVAAPAFADADTSPKNIESSSGTATFDVTANLTKDHASSTYAKDYYVTISWEMTPGSYVMTGDTYEWDAENMQYTRTSNGQSSSSKKITSDADAVITVVNQSNVDMSYEIIYASNKDSGGTGDISTEAKDDESANDAADTLESYATKNHTNATLLQNTVGADNVNASTAWSAGDAAKAVYTGKVTLSQYTANEYPVSSATLGSYTVTISESETVFYTLQGTNAGSTPLSAKGLLESSNTVSYEYGSKSCTAYNGYISATKGATWYDAMGFVAALNTAQIAPNGATYGTGSGEGTWRLLSSEDDLCAWYSKSGNPKSVDGVDHLWSSVELEDGTDKAYDWSCDDGTWFGYSKTDSSSHGGFVVVWAQN